MVVPELWVLVLAGSSPATLTVINEQDIVTKTKTCHRGGRADAQA